MMIPSFKWILFSFPVFLHRRSSKFSAPNYQGIFQQTSLFQIENQRSDGFIDLPAFVDKTNIDCKTGIATMTIPAPIEQLHKPHSFFHQFSCKQNIICKAGFVRLCAIHFVNIFRFIIDVHYIRN